MELQNNIVIIKLFFISFGLLTTTHASRSLQQYDDSPSSSSQGGVSLNYVSFPPTPSANPPNANAPSPTPSENDFIGVLKENIDQKVQSVCDSTDHPDLCLGMVVPSLGKAKVNAQTILQATLKATSTFAKMALSETEKLAEKPGTSPELASVLKDCKESYESSVDDFDEVVTAFSMGDIGTMNSKLSGVMMNAEDCEEGFQALGEESPLSRYAERLTEMASNCLAVVSVSH